MKNKFLVFSLIFALTASVASAQDEPRASFAVLGGINLQNFNGLDYSGDKTANDLMIGYHAGVNLNIAVAPQFYFQPGLLFSTKGSTNVNDIYTTKYKLSYIELPLNFLYRGALGGGHVLLGFGPYVAYAVTGKTIATAGSIDVETDIVFQKTVESGDPLATSYFKAFDAGGNIFVGYETAVGLFLQMNTQLGMLQINPDDARFPNSKSVVKNTGFGASLGFRF